MSPPSLSKMPYYIEIYYGHSNMVWTNSSFCVGTYICHHVALFGAQSITRCVWLEQFEFHLEEVKSATNSHPRHCNTHTQHTHRHVCCTLCNGISRLLETSTTLNRIWIPSVLFFLGLILEVNQTSLVIRFCVCVSARHVNTWGTVWVNMYPFDNRKQGLRWGRGRNCMSFCSYYYIFLHLKNFQCI